MTTPMPSGDGSLPTGVSGNFGSLTGPGGLGPSSTGPGQGPVGSIDGPGGLPRHVGRRNRDNSSTTPPNTRPSWLPPFRLGGNMPGIDGNDARDLITGRGNQQAAAQNKAADAAKKAIAAAGGGGWSSADNDTPSAPTTRAPDTPASGSGRSRGGRNETSRGRRQSQATATSQDPSQPGSTAKLQQQLNDLDLGPATVRNPAAGAGRALDYAAQQSQQATQNWVGMCMQFVRKSLGIDAFQNSSPGHPASAYNAWRDNVPAASRHFDKNPPAGVPVFWSGGSHGDGHAALSAGNGMIWSTDINRRGGVDLVPLTDIEKKWPNTHFLGWADTLAGHDLLGGGDAAGSGSGARHHAQASGVPNISGGTTSDDPGSAKSITSNTHSRARRTTGNVNAPATSTMPTTQGGLTAGLGSGMDTHAFGVAPTGPGGSYTKDEIKRLWIAAGGPADAADIAAAVAHAESGGHPSGAAATNHNSNGTTDYGLFQRNSASNGGSSADYDVETNVKWAVQQYLKDVQGAESKWGILAKFRAFNDWTDPAVEAYEKEHGTWTGRPGYNYPGYVAGRPSTDY